MGTTVRQDATKGMTTEIDDVTTIEEVLAGLDDVVARAVERGSRLGYFAALYRQVTLEVSAAIDRDDFDDGPRMSRFDAAFANRYFCALENWTGEDPCSVSWQEAFGAGERDGTAIVQHLFLGINAHINLDLPVAAAEVAPGAAIDDLRDDFFRINDILVDVLHLVQEALNGVSPFMRLLDVVGGRTDEQVLDFNIRRARREAWERACVLAHQTDAERQVTIDELDRRTTRLARKVVRPALLFRPVIAVIRAGERVDVPAAIRRLDAAVAAA